MKRKKYKVLFFVFLLFFLFTLSIFFSVITMGNNNIFSNIYIYDINLSNKSKNEAISILKKICESKINSEISLIYYENEENHEELVDPNFLDLNYNIDDAVNNAYNYGRINNIFKNNYDIAKLLFKKKVFTLNYSYDINKLNSLISEISSNLPDKMVETSYYIENGKLNIIKGKSGLIIDEESFLNNLKTFFENPSSNNKTVDIPLKIGYPEEIDIEKIHKEVYKQAKDAYYEDNPFKVYPEINGIDFDIDEAKRVIEENPDNNEYSIDLKYTKPEITIEELDVDIFHDLLGSFSTNFDVSNEDRNTNLNIAASKINGTILSPGEEFSYNRIVGERSISKGYKEAKIYSNGKVIDGIGGGICQISSTLYNAVIFANLKVTQRFNHQFLTSYVSAGRDATVAYGIKDLKFINNRTYPIKINVLISSGIAKVNIYGIKEDNEYQVDFESEIVSEIPFNTIYEVDSNLPAGKEIIKQRGINGIIVNVYKVIKKNGITISREFISKDKYSSIDRVISKSNSEE